MLEQDLLRNQRKRFSVLRHYEEVIHNVSKTCRYYGISQMAFYRWQHRYQEFGLEGLKDRSRRPLRSPIVLRIDHRLDKEATIASEMKAIDR